MKILASILLVFGFLNEAQAQYSCSDIPNIQSILNQLQRNCGATPVPTPPASFCRAKGYLGNDVISTINQCSASNTPYSRQTCISDLNCGPGIGYCIAKEYLSSNLLDVVNQCSASSTPYSRETCITAAVCKGPVPPYCNAKGYLATTAEEAVNLCSASSTPYSRETCVNAVVCN